MDSVKVAGVLDWPTLRNVTKVQSFMGFVNSKTSHTWPSPYTYSIRKGKHGDGPRKNKRPSRNSSSSSCQHPSLCNLTKMCNFSWKWMHLGMPPVPAYLNCARTTNGT